MVKMNNDWLIHFKGYEEQAKRFDDLVDAVVFKHRQIITPFLNEPEQEVLKKVVGSRCFMKLDGGYPEAEKKRALLCFDESEDQKVDLTLLKAEYAQTYVKLSHRDALGALLNIGLRSDQFGDISVKEGVIYVYTVSEVAQYIIDECRKIGRASIRFKICDQPAVIEKDIRWIQKIVSGNRLDTLVAACCTLSRSKAAALIKGGNVQVNHLLLEDCSALCNNNAVLSIRGYGRFIYKGICKQTKKEHYVIELGLFQ